MLDKIEAAKDDFYAEERKSLASQIVIESAERFNGDERFFYFRRNGKVFEAPKAVVDRIYLETSIREAWFVLTCVVTKTDDGFKIEELAYGIEPQLIKFQVNWEIDEMAGWGKGIKWKRGMPQLEMVEAALLTALEGYHKSNDHYLQWLVA